MSKRIGITTTVPHEIIVAAGHTPVDLNNLFIAEAVPAQSLERAEKEGFAANVCAWIKGIFAAATTGRVDAVVTVVGGDCSNTRALAEVLRHRGIPTIDFAFPTERDPREVEKALLAFAGRLGVSLRQAEQVRRDWQPLRRRLAELDRLAWEEDRVTSAELHGWLVAAGDFESDPQAFDRRLQDFLQEVGRRPPLPEARRLALLGVPPIFSDLFPVLEARGVRIVFDEVPRQFAMPYPCADLVEQFTRYTYPYDLPHRLADVRQEMEKRRIAGALHYLQAFCHRQIEHLIVREELPAPVLALEGDRPAAVSGQLLTRLDAFLEMMA